MDLLAFARGPALTVATAIFITGVVWRIVGILLLRMRRNLSEPRSKAAWKGLALIGSRSTPKKELASASLMEAIGYIFHLGIFAAFLLYLPHVLFFQNILTAFLPLSVTQLLVYGWPTLPGALIFFLTSVSIACLLILIVHRLTNPVKRLISNFDDYMSWLMTILPLVTGMAAYSHFGAPYQYLLAAHILSVEALMIWFPFGKLMHMFTMFVLRGATGIIFARKGAAM